MRISTGFRLIRSTAANAYRTASQKTPEDVLGMALDKAFEAAEWKTLKRVVIKDYENS